MTHAGCGTPPSASAPPSAIPRNTTACAKAPGLAQPWCGRALPARVDARQLVIPEAETGHWPGETIRDPRSTNGAGDPGSRCKHRIRDDGWRLSARARDRLAGVARPPGILEAVHVERPLQADQRALDARQQ